MRAWVIRNPASRTGKRICLGNIEEKKGEGPLHQMLRDHYGKKIREARQEDQCKRGESSLLEAYK